MTLAPSYLVKKNIEHKIIKLFLKFKTLKNLVQLSSQDKQFCSYSLGKWDKESPDFEGELLLDLMDYDHYIFQQSYITNFFKFDYKLSLFIFISYIGKRKS